MSASLRALIIATCVAVISAIGFWSWKVLRDETLATEAARQRSVEAGCQELLEDVTQRTNAGRNLLEVAICMESGHITKKQLVDGGRQDVADQIDDYEKKKAGTP